MPADHRSLSRVTRAALWSSVPIALAGLAASIAGVFTDSPYASESLNWATQGAGQDAVNLAIYPALVAVAWMAGRGSVRAYLGWLGLLAYSAYSYVVYAGFVHFSGWFLLYVAIFGMSTYALIVGVSQLDPALLRRAFSGSTPTKAIGTLLTVLGGAFILLWLSEIVPSALSGDTPAAITEAGQVTNPIWMLDLGLVLPAMVVAGTLLRRGRAMGFVLAGMLLGFGIAMSAAILGMQAMLAIEGFEGAATPAVMMSLVMLLEIVAMWRFLAGVTPGLDLPHVLRLPVSDTRGSTPTPHTLAH